MTKPPPHDAAAACWRRAALTLLLACAAATAAGADEDHRAWQHGIDFVRVGGRLLLVWGSAGNPPKPNLGGAWPHDIYYAWLDDPAAPEPKLEPRVLVSRPEAQEPPSTAINARGTILVTSEDGEHGINQYAGTWDSSLRELRSYPFQIRRGGHSGHVAAMGERFLVAYGEGWVDGGAWRGLGTGESVYARIVEDSGELRPEVKLSAGTANPRDSWPLVAASDRNWLVVWQRYPALTLQSALVDASGKVARRFEIAGGLPLRYAYDVQFSPRLGAYVVAGTSGERGFVALVDRDGKLLRRQSGLPPMAGEGRIVMGVDGAQVIGVYPVSPRGVAVVPLSAGGIGPARVVDHPHAWDYSGTAGVFVAPGRVLFATLSTRGLRLVPVNLKP